MNESQKLFKKIEKSKNKSKTIEEEELKISTKLKNYLKKNNPDDKNGVLKRQIFVWISLLTTLKDIKNNNIIYENLVNPNKLYDKIVMKKN
jgi:hypothetical protein